MSELSSDQGVIDKRAQRADERRQKVADRITDRALSSFHDNKLALAVKGGRLGLNNTLHETGVYDLVAARLAEHEIEITVHRISQVSAVGHVTFNCGVADVISAATIKDWPKYIASNPVSHPEAFTAASHIGAGEIPCTGPYAVEQIYPPSAR